MGTDVGVFVIRTQCWCVTSVAGCVQPFLFHSLPSWLQMSPILSTSPKLLMKVNLLHHDTLTSALSHHTMYVVSVCDECAYSMWIEVVVLFRRWSGWSNSYQHSLRHDGTEGWRRPLAECWKGQTDHVWRGVWWGLTHTNTLAFLASVSHQCSTYRRV